MKTLDVGVVGCGGIANAKYLPAMKRHGKRKLLCIPKPHFFWYSKFN